MVFFWLVVLVGLLWTPLPALEQSFREARLSFPGWPHVLGVDGLGRDYFSRLWLGGAWTLLLGCLIMAGTLLSGALTVWATVKGPRIVGVVIESLLPLGLTLPVILLALLLLAAFGPSLLVLVAAVILGNWVFAFRQIRVLWRQHSGREYVEASRVLGASGWHLFRRTIWPNLVADVLALVRLFWAIGILEVSGLAFLGLIGDPDFPELGAILRQNQSYLFQAPLFAIIPGALLSLILISIRCIPVVKTCNAR